MVYPATVWNVVFDALSYYGSGSYNTYSRCFSRCCQGMGFDMTPDDLLKVRSRLFWSFKNSGMVDVVTNNGNTLWTISPSSLIECVGLGFVLQASSYVANSLLMHLGSTTTYHLERVPIWGRLSPEQTTAHFLMFDKLTKQLLSACADVGVRVVQGAHKELLRCLPSLSDVISGGMAAAEPGVNYREVFTKRFDMCSMTWLDVDSQQDLQECLYRIDRPFMECEFVIVHRREDNLLGQAVCRVGEWSHIIAAELLGHRVPVSYDRHTKEMRIPIGFHLPVLVQRVLFTASMRFPRFSGGELVFFSIPYTTVQKLCELYTFFQLRSF